MRTRQRLIISNVDDYLQLNNQNQQSGQVQCHCPVTECCKKTVVLRRPFKNASKKFPKQYFLAAAEQVRNVLLQCNHDCNNMNTKALQKEVPSESDW